MPLTRANSKGKRLQNTVTTKKKNPTRSISAKRSTSTSKGKTTKRSTIVRHISYDDTDEENSSQKDSLTIDCQDESSNGSISTSKNDNVSDHDTHDQIRPLNSSVIAKNSTTTPADLRTERAYHQLEAVISSCSPIVARIEPTNSSSAVHMDDDDVHLPRPSFSITPTLVRTNITTYSRSEPRARQHLSSQPIVRPLVNGSHESPSYRHRLNVNRNHSATQQNNFRSTTSTQRTTSNVKSVKHITVSSAFSNLSILETIPEYINLKNTPDREIERCKTWREDYLKLRAEFDDYRERSFPRPSVDGLNFLLELVENLTNTTSSLRTRSTSELAKSIGISEEDLIECRHIKPQRAALSLFNKLYPTPRQRAKLISIKKFARKKTQLLNDILQFARQCNPSVIFTTEKMREAIGSSIRQSKHHVNKFLNVELNLVELNNQEMVDENGIEVVSKNNSSVMDIHSDNFDNKSSNDDSVGELDQMDEQ